MGHFGLKKWSLMDQNWPKTGPRGASGTAQGPSWPPEQKTTLHESKNAGVLFKNSMVQRRNTIGLFKKHLSGSSSPPMRGSKIGQNANRRHRKKRRKYGHCFGRTWEAFGTHRTPKMGASSLTKWVVEHCPEGGRKKGGKMSCNGPPGNAKTSHFHGSVGQKHHVATQGKWSKKRHQREGKWDQKEMEMGGRSPS